MSVFLTILLKLLQNTNFYQITIHLAKVFSMPKESVRGTTKKRYLRTRYFVLFALPMDLTQVLFEPVIGLEVHVQLNTKSKLFCADKVIFGDAPNADTSIVSLGLPGSLPVLNRKCIDHAITLGLAVNSSIANHVFFARKNYFYSDLPKGYQITQNYEPICQGGHIHIRLDDGSSRDIRLHHIHIEEDAGKSIHDQTPDSTLIDLNRAGVPLLEIVSEPDLRSADEAYHYLAEIRRLVRYLEISDGNMEEASLRCDANVSVRPAGSKTLGTRTEIKNLNSLNFVRKAIEQEIHRQIGVIRNGGEIKQQTLSFDPSSGTSVPMRSKEEAHDYRYFPEPDLPPVNITKEHINELQKKLPPLPEMLYLKFTNEYGLSEYDAALLSEDKNTALYFDRLATIVSNRKAAANWVIGPVRSWLTSTGSDISHLKISPETLAKLIDLVDKEVLNFTIASQQVFSLLEQTGSNDPRDLAEEHSLLQDNNKQLLQKLIAELILQNQEKAEQYRKGKKGLLSFFMGEVMKATRGKANPKVCQELLRTGLSKENNT